MISIKEIDILAELSKLNFDEVQKIEVADYIKMTAESFAVLDKYNTDKVEATHHLFGMHNVLRDDAATEEGAGKEELLKRAPRSDGDYVIVPEVLDG